MQRQSQIIFSLDSAQLFHWSWQQGSAFKPLFLLFPKQVLRNASRVPVKFLGGSCFGLGRIRLQTQFGELAFVKGRGRSKPGPRRKWSSEWSRSKPEAHQWTQVVCQSVTHRVRMARLSARQQIGAVLWRLKAGAVPRILFLQLGAHVPWRGIWMMYPHAYHSN